LRARLTFAAACIAIETTTAIVAVAAFTALATLTTVTTLAAFATGTTLPTLIAPGAFTFGPTAFALLPTLLALRARSRGQNVDLRLHHRSGGSRYLIGGYSRSLGRWRCSSGRLLGGSSRL
jgi:hypothetical protein